MIWGAPGIGKSQIVKQMAKDRDISIIDIRLSTYDPTDLKGVPAIVKNKAVWLDLNELPTEERDGPQGVLFLDEINSAPPSTAAAAYRLILDGEIANYRLPAGWSIVAAGNRDSDKGVTYKMPAPLANRFTHLELEVDFDDWCNWAINKDVDVNVLSYIRYRPNNLNNFDPTQRAFPTPRMWERVSDYTKISSPLVRHTLICGAVGDGVGTEFESFLKIAHSLQDPDYIIMNPDEAEVPKELSAIYATVGALAVRSNPSNFDRVMKFADKLSKEFQVLLVRDASKRNKEIANTQAFATWAIKNADVLI
jgi:hypothetical protein